MQIGEINVDGEKLERGMKKEREKASLEEEKELYHLYGHHRLFIHSARVPM